MAGIAVPRPQLTQPQGRLQVARRWANNLRGAFLLRDRTVFDPVSGLLLSGSGAQSVEPFGTAYALSASSHYIDTGVTDVGGVTLHAEDGKPFSVTVRFRAGGTGTILARAGASTATRTFQIFSNGAAQSPTIVVRGTQTIYNWGYQDGEWHIVTVAWDGASVSVFGDTDREATPSRGTTPEETTQRVLIGARTNGANFVLTSGAVEFAYFFDRALTRDEHLALVDNPYQVFRTERRLYAVEATSGGTDATATGATITATASVIAGGASGGAGATAAGTTVTATASIAAGAASGVRNATAAGTTVTATASLTAGTATGAGGASALGALLTAAASLIAGAASGVRNATASGALLTATALLSPGSANNGELPAFTSIFGLVTRRRRR